MGLTIKISTLDNNKNFILPALLGDPVIILHKNQLQNLAKLKLIFKNLVALPNHKNLLISFLDKNKRAVIIIVAENKEKAIEGIKILRAQKEINPKKWWAKF